MNEKKKKQLTDPNTKMNQMLELSDKNLKTAIVKVFQQSIMNSLKTGEK